MPYEKWVCWQAGETDFFFTNSPFQCKSWQKNSFMRWIPLNCAKTPPQRRAAKKCPLCTLTSRLINTWSENHLPWLPPSELLAARSSSSSSRWASQWERTKLAFVGHINCIQLKQNVAAPGVASGKVREWRGITGRKKRNSTASGRLFLLLLPHVSLSPELLELDRMPSPEVKPLRQKGFWEQRVS